MILSTLQQCIRANLIARGVRSRQISAAAGRVHAYDARGSGSLPPIAILHGLGGSAASSARLMLALRRRSRRVLALDLPGHGLSAPPADGLTFEALEDVVRQTLDATLDEPAVLLGNSLGGALAIRYALSRPHRVRGLVVTSPAGARVDAGDLEALRAVFAVKTTDDVRSLVSRLLDPVPWYVTLVAGELRRSIGGAYIQGLLASLTLEHTFTAQQLAGLSMPTLVLWGTRERVFPRTHLQFWRDHLPPHVLIEEPEGFGHSPHLDSWSDLAARIEAFASTLA